MRRIITMAGAVLLSLSLAAAGNAAPDGKAGASNGKGAAPKTSQGLQNSRKVVEAKADGIKKTQDLKKRAYAKRQQAQK